MAENKRAMQIFLVEVAVLVLFFGACFWMLRDYSGVTSKRADRISLDGGWEVTVSGETVYYDELPTAIRTSADNTIWLSRKISEVSGENNVVGLFSFQKTVHAYIDGEEVLVFENNTRAHSKMPGNSWLFVDLRPEDTGKTLALQLHQCYGSGQVMVPVLYGGTVEGIINSYMKEKLLLIFFSVIGVALGWLSSCSGLSRAKACCSAAGFRGWACLQSSGVCGRYWKQTFIRFMWITCSCGCGYPTSA